jgi:peptidoglycan/LPS O-acetylase OafA/YrhL
MRLSNLQALRGIACLLVLGFHVAEWEWHRCEAPTVRFAGAFEYFGFVGVDLFFVLSGFVITWVSLPRLGQRSQSAGFLFRRAWRIFPLYWACWTLVILAYVHILGIPWLPTWRWLIGNLTLLPAQPKHLFIPQAWSLAYELLFYGSFAAFFLLPRRAFLPGLALWFAAIGILGATGGAGSEASGPLGRNVARLVNPLVLEFILGCLAGYAVRTERGLAAGRWLLVLGIAGFAASGSLEARAVIHTKVNEWQRVGTFGIACALIVFGATACERRYEYKSPRWLQFVGDASYSIYLIHIGVLEVVQHWLAHWRHDFAQHLFYVVALVAGSLAAGFAVHFAIERPLMRLVERKKSAPRAGFEPLRQAA